MNQQASPNFARAIVVFHHIITRGLAVSIENAGRGNSALEVNRSGFSDYVHSLASLLHAHHLAEDEIVFPYMKTVLPDPPYEKLSSDHKLMESMIETLENANERWKSGAGDALDEVSSSVKSINELWHPHIAIEEEEIYVPEKLEELIEPQEHVRLMQQSAELSFKSFGPHYLVVPFMLYNLEPGPRSMLASGMPSEMTEKLVPVDWKDKWSPMKPFLLE
jgi:hemerythrin-like domain-containing protein